MDRDIWQLIAKAIKRACAKAKVPGRKCKFSHALILKMYLWSTWQDRSLSWACDRSHYGDLFRPRKLPSISQFSRRVREESFQEILQRVHWHLVGSGLASEMIYIDGKPLTVSAVSKDPDAHRGHVSGGFARGYKLHVIVSECRKVLIWSVMPLNVAEQSVAMEMSQRLPEATSNALVMADGNYDSAPLHKVLDEGNRRLLTPLKGQNQVKEGKHHPVTLRQMGACRREALQVHKAHPQTVQFVLKQRNNVEGVFSVLTTALHMGPPPAWVRRTERVRRWTGAKIILYNARLTVQVNQARREAAGQLERLIA